MKKIMILTSEKTGNGHKSASNALQRYIDNDKYEIKQIDSFVLMGKLGMLLEKIYIPLTTTFPILYYIPFLLTQAFPDVMHVLVYLKLRRKLSKEIKEYDPDLIITVHSMFTKSISHLLKKEKLNIPFYIDVIDLVNPPKVWLDKRADVIFVPTENVKNDYIKKGVNKNKIFESGFPIRSDIKRRNTPKVVENNVNILLVNPSVNVRKNVKFVKEVSKINNSSVSVICGRDKRMYNRLIKNQQNGKIPKTTTIYGFVNNMNEFLDNSHILHTKAGPNMRLEGERSATATVITGNILGQENNNYKYVVENKFGFKCKNPNKIYNMLNDFISSKELNKCLENVLKSDCSGGAEYISNFIDKNFN